MKTKEISELQKRKITYQQQIIRNLKSTIKQLKPGLKKKNKARKNATLNSHIRLKVIRKYDFKCIYCNHEGSQQNPLTVDHIYPKGLGGTNRQDNLACCCKECNSKKQNMLLTEFIKKYNIELSWNIASFL